MKKYSESNKQAIIRGLSRLRRDADEVMRIGMHEYLEAALDYLISVHKDGMLHTEESDTLGCAIVHNGQLIEVWGQDRGASAPDNSATEMLKQKAMSVPKQGWVGIVLSGMHGWYSVDLELDYLNQTVDWSKGTFMNYFKPL